ncbi:MAG: hypothetical protein AAF590_04250 [Pseudomonadota bacterium]
MTGTRLSHAGARAPLDPGSLSIRMQVLEPVASDDGMGGGAVSYAVRRSLWAAFEPDAPAQSAGVPIRDASARGRVRTNLGIAPPPGWRLSWQSISGTGTFEVLAREIGTRTFPYDLCDVREVVS